MSRARACSQVGRSRHADGPGHAAKRRAGGRERCRRTELEEPGESAGGRGRSIQAGLTGQVASAPGGHQNAADDQHKAGEGGRPGAARAAAWPTSAQQTAVCEIGEHTGRGRADAGHGRAPAAGRPATTDPPPQTAGPPPAANPTGWRSRPPARRAGLSHSLAVNTLDQASPNTTWASRNAAQSALMGCGFVGGLGAPAASCTRPRREPPAAPAGRPAPACTDARPARSPRAITTTTPQSDMKAPSAARREMGTPYNTRPMMSIHTGMLEATSVTFSGGGGLERHVLQRVVHAHAQQTEQGEAAPVGPQPAARAQHPARQRQQHQQGQHPAQKVERDR